MHDSSKSNVMRKVGVYIGRFQPFHLGHASIVCQMVEENCDLLIILVGSAKNSRTPKNPWSDSERIAIISLYVRDEFGPNRPECVILGVPDFLRDADWEEHVQSLINNYTYQNDRVLLYGHDKDLSTAYLKKFPNLEYRAAELKTNINATEIRNWYFDERGHIRPDLPLQTLKFLEYFEKTPSYSQLKKEHDFLKSYQKQFEGLKYQPTFVTVDAVIFNQQGKVCLIRRKEMPGQNQYALPGGFVDPNMSLLHSVIQATKDKTGITLNPDQTFKSTVFDQPERSLRGRTITHAFLFKLPTDSQFDTSRCHWLNVNQLFLYEEEMFEDHKLIIQSML